MTTFRPPQGHSRVLLLAKENEGEDSDNNVNPQGYIVGYRLKRLQPAYIY